MTNKNGSAVRVAIYARVSSEQQAKAATIESQVQALVDRAAQDGHELEEEFRFIDAGYSGASLVRPALEQLRDVAYAGGIDRLYVHSPDRLARKYAYQVLLIEEFDRAGVEVVFLNHAMGKTPEEDLLLQMQGMIAEYERAKILERSRRGKRHAARRGEVSVLSGAPYGYRYVSKRESGDVAQYQVVLEEAHVVRQVFQWVGRDSLSLRDVCRRLKEQQVKTRTGKDWWDPTTIAGWLKNPAYKGSAAYGKTRIGPRRLSLRSGRGRPEQPRRNYSTYDTEPNDQELIEVPRLVSDELFEAAAQQLAENRRRNRQGRRGAMYLLQGLLQCQCCGYSYYGKPISRRAAKGKTRTYAYYRCIGSDAYRFGGQRVCENKQVRTDLLEEAVWEDLSSLLKNPERVAEEYERRLRCTDKDGADVHELTSLIQKVKLAIARLIDAYQDGLLSRDEFQPRISRSKERLGKLEAEAATLTSRQSEADELRLTIGHLQDFHRHLHEGLEHVDWKTKREIIRALVKRVEIGDQFVRVVYKVSPPPFASGLGKRVLQQVLDAHRAPQPIGELAGDVPMDVAELQDQQAFQCGPIAGHRVAEELLMELAGGRRPNFGTRLARSISYYHVGHAAYSPNGTRRPDRNRMDHPTTSGRRATNPNARLYPVLWAPQPIRSILGPMASAWPTVDATYREGARFVRKISALSPLKPRIRRISRRAITCGFSRIAHHQI